MKKSITSTVAAAAVLGALVACDTPAFAAGEQITYQFCSDTSEVSTVNWFDADNDQVSRSNLVLSRREPVRPVVAVAAKAGCGMTTHHLQHPLVDLAGAEVVEYWTPIGERYVTLHIVDRGQGFDHVDIPLNELVVVR